MSDTALLVRMSEDKRSVEVVSGDGSGELRIYTLTPDQAQRFGMTMQMCALEASLRRSVDG